MTTTHRQPPPTRRQRRRPSREPLGDRRIGCSTGVCAGVLHRVRAALAGAAAWAMDTSLKPERGDHRDPAELDPSNPTLDAFRTVLDQRRHPPLVRQQPHHLVADGARRIVLVPAWRRSRCPGCGSAAASALFWFILAGIMIPPQVLIVPLFREMRRLRPAQHLLGGDPAAGAHRDRGVHLQAVLRRPARATRGGGPGRRRRLLRIYWRIVHAAGPARGRRGGDLHLRRVLEQLPLAAARAHRPRH